MNYSNHLNNQKSANLTTLSDQILTTLSPSSSEKIKGKGLMKSIALGLTCIGMSNFVQAQERDNLSDDYTTTVIRQSSDAPIGTISGSFTVTGSSNVRGLYGETGILQIDKIDANAVFNIHSTKNNAFGIDAGSFSNSVNLEIGELSGTLNVTATNTNATGIRSYGKQIIINSITSEGKINVEANYSSNGINAYQGSLTIGELSGLVSVQLGTGNFARGLVASGQESSYNSRYKDVNIGHFTSSGRIIATTAQGYGSKGIQSTYGQVNIENFEGSILSHSTGSNSSGFSAIGIQSAEALTIGNISETAKITVSTPGNGAYGIYAGSETGSSFSKISLGDIAGDIDVEGGTGTVQAIRATSSIQTGDISGFISANSTNGATTYGILADSTLVTGDISGTIIASGSGTSNVGLMGTSIQTTLLSASSLHAYSDVEGSLNYAIFSGTTQLGFSAYNYADTITIHAGASILGTIELGGSGIEGQKDTFNLLGGSEIDPGLFNYTVQTTINTIQNAENTRHSSVLVNIGNKETPSYWTIDAIKANDLINELVIEQGSTLEVINGSLNLRDGASISIKGDYISTAPLSITSNMTLFNGLLELDDNQSSLITKHNGLHTQLDLAQGATIGSTVYNDTDTAWILNQNQIEQGIIDFYSSFVENFDIENYHLAYRLEGQIFLGEGKPITVKPGQHIIVGTGSKIIVDKDLPTNGLYLDGGEADLSKSDLNINSDQIKGSSGLLTLSTDHTLTWSSTQSIGYDVQALNGGNIKLLDINADGSTITASGSYKADTIRIRNNSTLILEGQTASLGVEGGMIILGYDLSSPTDISSKSIDKPGHLILNNSTILSKLDINKDCTVSGTGVFKDVVNCFNGQLIIGQNNLGGYQEYQGGLESWSGGKFVFNIDGTTQASLEQSGQGTYSHIEIFDQYYVYDAQVKAVIGNGIALAPTKSFSLTLISLDANTDIKADSLDDLIGYKPEISGATDLVKDLVFSVSPDGLHLILTGSVNEEAILNMRREEAGHYANTLWSSSQAVKGFAQSMIKPQGHRVKNQTSVWASGNGYFNNASSDGNLSGFNFQSGGYGIGTDYSYADQALVGLAFGQYFGSFHAKNNQFRDHQRGEMFSLFHQNQWNIAQKHHIDVDTYLTYGHVNNKAHGTLASLPSTAKWNDNVP